MDFLQIHNNSYFFILSHSDCVDLVMLEYETFEFIFDDDLWSEIVQLPLDGLSFFLTDSFAIHYLTTAVEDIDFHLKVEDLQRLKKHHFRFLYPAD